MELLACHIEGHIQGHQRKDMYAHSYDSLKNCCDFLLHLGLQASQKIKK